MPTLHIHTHCQAPRANAKSQSLSKSVSVPAHGRQKRCSKLKEKMTENKEHQPLIEF